MAQDKSKSTGKPSDPKTSKAMREFDRLAAAFQRQLNLVRRGGVGILTPAIMRKHLKSGQDVVLAYGRQGLTQTYTLQDLKRFADSVNHASRKFQAGVRGVPLLQLEQASLDKDKQRAKQVRSARLYKIDGDLLYFRVSGNDRPAYLVRIRMEEFNTLATARVYASPFAAAKRVAMGNLSIDCQCGRHQYWYRYLANIGGYDVSPPKEQGFPKIRNPGLTGCCCKHVLKVLSVLKTTAVLNVIAKSIEKRQEQTAFASDKQRHFLTNKELESTSKVRGITSRTPKEARQAYNAFLKSAREALQQAAKDEKVREKKARLKPRKTDRKPPKPTPEVKPVKEIDISGDVYKELVGGLRTVMGLVKANMMPRDMALQGISQTRHIPVEQLEAIIRKEKLDE